jgi:hypothetical protein
VFAKLSQLVQSALDGYNVCIFTYGKTLTGRKTPAVSESGERAGSGCLASPGGPAGERVISGPATSPEVSPAKLN